MRTTNSVSRISVMTRINPHSTGHAWAPDGTLLRVDYERGLSWVATHYGPDLRVIKQVRGSDEEVHRIAARWAQSGEAMIAARPDPKRSHKKDESVMRGGH